MEKDEQEEHVIGKLVKWVREKHGYSINDASTEAGVLPSEWRLAENNPSDMLDFAKILDWVRTKEPGCLTTGAVTARSGTGQMPFNTRRERTCPNCYAALPQDGTRCRYCPGIADID